jgi:hypothetical protein
LEAKLQDLLDRSTYVDTMYLVPAGLFLNCEEGQRHAETIFDSVSLNRCLLIIPEHYFQENLNNLHHLDVEEDEKVLSTNTNIRNLRLKVKLLKLLPSGHQLFQPTH